MVFKKTSFKIPDNKTVVIFGDSHPQCAINDEILTNSFNFAQSAAHNFYSLLQLKKILKENDHITTVVFGYSYHNLTSDDHWLSSNSSLMYKLPKYFFLMSPSDILVLIKENAIGVIKTFFASYLPLMEDLIKVKDITRNKNWGGYQYLDKNNLNINLESQPIGKDNKPNEFQFTDSKDLEYLREMYEISIQNGKNVILINTPIFIDPLEENTYLEHYYSFANSFLSKAYLLNHASLKIPIEGYGDATHLNYKGAEYYSNYLKDNYLLSIE